MSAPTSSPQLQIQLEVLDVVRQLYPYFIKDSKLHLAASFRYGRYLTLSVPHFYSFCCSSLAGLPRAFGPGQSFWRRRTCRQALSQFGLFTFFLEVKPLLDYIWVFLARYEGQLVSLWGHLAALGLNLPYLTPRNGYFLDHGAVCRVHYSFALHYTTINRPVVVLVGLLSLAIVSATGFGSSFLVSSVPSSRHRLPWAWSS